MFGSAFCLKMNLILGDGMLQAGVCFAFIEYDEPSSAQSAIEVR